MPGSLGEAAVHASDCRIPCDPRTPSNPTFSTRFCSDANRHTIDESFEIKVRNHKDATITVIVKETLYRWSGWEIRAKSHPVEQIDSRTIHIPVRVKPGGEVTGT